MSILRERKEGVCWNNPCVHAQNSAGIFRNPQALISCQKLAIIWLRRAINTSVLPHAGFCTRIDFFFCLVKRKRPLWVQCPPDQRPERADTHTPLAEPASLQTSAAFQFLARQQHKGKKIERKKKSRRFFSTGAKALPPFS